MVGTMNLITPVLRKKPTYVKQTLSRGCAMLCASERSTDSLQACSLQDGFETWDLNIACKQNRNIFTYVHTCLYVYIYIYMYLCTRIFADFTT